VSVKASANGNLPRSHAVLKDGISEAEIIREFAGEARRAAELRTKRRKSKSEI
jgi:hypothetical protein